jgi:hypothetical protein
MPWHTLPITIKVPLPLPAFHSNAGISITWKCVALIAMGSLGFPVWGRGSRDYPRDALKPTDPTHVGGWRYDITINIYNMGNEVWVYMDSIYLFIAGIRGIE